MDAVKAGMQVGTARLRTWFCCPSLIQICQRRVGYVERVEGLPRDSTNQTTLYYSVREVLLSIHR